MSLERKTHLKKVDIVYILFLLLIMFNAICVEIICDTILRHYQIGRTFESSGSSALLLGLIGGSGMVLLIMILVGCAIAKRKQTTKNIPDSQRGKKQEQCQNTASHHNTYAMCCTFSNFVYLLVP